MDTRTHTHMEREHEKRGGDYPEGRVTWLAGGGVHHGIFLQARGGVEHSMRVQDENLVDDMTYGVKTLGKVDKLTSWTSSNGKV